MHFFLGALRVIEPKLLLFHIYIIRRVIVLEWARRTKYQRDVFTKNHVFGRYFWTFLCLVELDNDLFRCRGVNLVKK